MVKAKKKRNKKPILKKSPKDFYFEIGLLTLLCVLGYYLRLGGISIYAFTFDDISNLSAAAGEGFRGVIDRVYKNEAHPPLIYLFLHAVISISKAPEFIRFVMASVGIGVMLMAYILYKKMFGRPAALFIAIILCMGYLSLLLSMQVRNYQLFMLLYFAALYFLFLYRENRNFNLIKAYFLCMAFAVSTNFSAIILFVVTTPLTFIFFAESEKSSLKNFLITRKKEIAIMLMLSVTPPLIFIFFSLDRIEVPVTFLNYGGVDPFLKNPLNFFNNFSGIIHILFLQANDSGLYSKAISLIYLTGLIILFRKKDFYLFYLAAIPVILAFILALLELYPFVPYRHNFFLVPSIFISLAAIVSKIAESKIFKEKEIAMTTQICCLILLAFFSYKIAEKNFYLGTFSSEINSYKKDYDRLFAEANKIKPDIVFTDGLIARYFVFEEGSAKEEKLAGDLRRINHRGLKIYYIDDGLWPLTRSKAQLRNFLKAIDKEESIKNKKLLYIRFGNMVWYDEILFNIFNGGGSKNYQDAIISRYNNPSARAMLMSGSKLAKIIADKKP